jgi:hypothetical protein
MQCTGLSRLGYLHRRFHSLTSYENRPPLLLGVKVSVSPHSGHESVVAAMKSHPCAHGRRCDSVLALPFWGICAPAVRGTDGRGAGRRRIQSVPVVSDGGALTCAASPV